MMPTLLRDALAERLEREAADSPFSLALATAEDIPQMNALNAKVVSDLPGGGMFMRQEAGFFAAIMARGGAAILVRSGRALVGYAVAAPVGPVFPVFAEQGGTIGLLFGTAVARAARGHRLQSRMIDLRCDAMRACGYDAVQATVAPTNHASLSNLLKTGFEVMALRTLLDGHPRFVVQRALNPACAGRDPVDESVPLPPGGSLSRHDTMLTAGARGTGMVWAPRPALLYRPTGSAGP